MTLRTMILLPTLLGLTLLCVSIAAEDEEVYEIKIPEITQDVRYDQSISERVSQSIMNLAHNLATALDTNEYPNTQIFSPVSIMSALALLQMGSNGNTFKELNQLLNDKQPPILPWKIHEELGWLLEDVALTSVNRRRLHNPAAWRSTPFVVRGFGKPEPNNLGGHTIRISNGLFIDNSLSLKPDYAFAAQSVYKSEVTTLDFKNRPGDSKGYINSWVNQNTLGKIPVIIDDELQTNTKMILASTLYFKGFWEKLFFKSGNRKEAFYPDGPDSLPVGVTYMGTGGIFPFYHSAEYDCRILGLPYNGNQTTMYIIQPNDSTRLKLQQLQKDLTGERLTELISKMEYKSATVVMPKFHVTSKIDLKNALQAMGIKDIFNSKAADFSLMADPEEAASSSLGPSSSSFGAVPVSSSQQLEAFAPAPARAISAAFGSDRSYFSGLLDRYDEAPLIFSRFSEDTAANETSATEQPKVEMSTNSTESSKSKEEEPKSEPPAKDKEVEKEEKPKSRRRRRQAVPESAQSLQRLDQLRSTSGLRKPPLYVDQILHKIDFDVNEQGTEAAAATLGALTRTGPEVSMRCDAPYLVLVRHDPTKLALFYGIINIPV